ncbi:MAG TPA: hypothetical protein VMO24_06490, partial [Woeseiaceae bacterium]|nr:hypothetical protein [Woeseiaceae bacterium]
VSGTVMSLLVLKQGAALAAVQGVIAVALLAVISLLLQSPVSQVFANAAVIWVPVMLLAALLRSRRSVTLTLQVAALVALAATCAFYLALGDPAAYWSDVLVNVAAAFRDMGLQQHADALLEQRDVVAAQMTTLVVLTTWSLYVTVLLLGYAIYRSLSEKPGEVGRLCDLNLGKVLALTMAVTSVMAVVTGSVWLQNVAFVAFALFWLQGLAIVHWLHAAGRLPVLVVIMVYALIPLLNALLIMALAVVGYIDAWFDFRRRKMA